MAVRRASHFGRYAALALSALVAAGCVLPSGGFARAADNTDPGASGEEVTAARVGGQDLTCTDFRGRAVRMYTVAGLGDVGYSELFFRVPVIKLDPDVLATLSDKLQIFFFLHECAHHKLAHLVNVSETAELEADCWAIRTGRDMRLLSRDDVAGFRERIAASLGSRSGHPPGPERHARMMTCFED